MTWVKSKWLVVSYHILRWFLRQTMWIQGWLHDITPGLRFAWAKKVANFVLDCIVVPLELTLAGILESILITQRRVPWRR